jgi:oligosaccharide reducing-end xylanase
VIPSSAGGFRRTRPVSRCLLILLACVPLAAQGQESGAGAVAANRYRNLFVEAGTSKEEVKRKVNTAFQQLFHGDPKTEAIYYAAGKNANGDLAYIVDVIHNDVRSEGMSYGMMIAVQLDKRREFDAIWNWARTYMFRNEPGHPARGFFSWSMKVDGTPNDETPAPDGEEYFAMALYFAAGRWGAGSGIYNYRAEADRLLADMLHREVVTGTTKRGPHTSGNMFEEKYKMVRFVPGLDRNGFTDPSYHLPAFYELWALWGPPADRPFWAQAAEASRDFFQKATNPATALAPDYANFDGTPYSDRWNAGAANFRFDAWRTAMNWSADWDWWAKDPRERQLSDRLQAFFAAQGIATYGNQFTLDGKPLGASHSPGLVAMNAVASLAATNPRAKDFVRELWKTPIPSGPGRYYDGTLYLLAMLHCSGEFRAWAPMSAGAKPLPGESWDDPD